MGITYHNKDVAAKVVGEALKGKSLAPFGLDSLRIKEVLQLMLLLLTVKGKRDKQEAIMRAVEVAKRLPDHRQKVETLAGILTFTDKVIDEEYREKVKEELEMTQIVQMIFDEGAERGEEIGRKKGEAIGERRGEKRGEKQGREQAMIDLICRKLRKDKSPQVIAEELEENIELINRVCHTAEPFAPDYDSRKVYRAWKNRRIQS